MRVRISYETDFENVPEELSALVAKSQNQHIQKAVQDLIDAFEELKKDENPNLRLVIEKVEKARANLFQADSLLNDVNNLLVGYTKAQVDPKSLEAQPTDTSPEIQTVEIDETSQTR